MASEWLPIRVSIQETEVRTVELQADSLTTSWAPFGTRHENDPVAPLENPDLGIRHPLLWRPAQQFGNGYSC
jgi:hypothetical protein